MLFEFQKVATCPVDRKTFPAILVKKELNGKVFRIVDVEVENVGNASLFDDYDTDPTYCEVCGHCDREDRLLLCDGCDLGFHMECLEPPMEFVPIEDWFCPACQTQRLAVSSLLVFFIFPTQSSLTITCTFFSPRKQHNAQVGDNSVCRELDRADGCWKVFVNRQGEKAQLYVSL